tara:strand:+ start:275 stop:946 length:672 start_codon:yes stop_codon:yes gene_type:complete
MKALKDQNKTMVNIEEVNNKTSVDNDNVREKIKNLIKKKNYNLRDLSRNIKKNDAYLQQYLYRGTPKVLPEKYRYLLAELLDVNVNELIPNWLKNISSQEKFFILRNIENKIANINQISFSKELLLGLDFFDEKNLYYFQTYISDCKITTIVDVSIEKFIKPDIYLLNDKKNYFLATIEFSKLSQSKLSVKPYFNDFSPFQINANLLNISGLILWQCSKIFSK